MRSQSAFGVAGNLTTQRCDEMSNTIACICHACMDYHGADHYMCVGVCRVVLCDVLLEAEERTCNIMPSTHVGCSTPCMLFVCGGSSWSIAAMALDGCDNVLWIACHSQLALVADAVG